MPCEDALAALTPRGATWTLRSVRSMKEQSGPCHPGGHTHVPLRQSASAAHERHVLTEQSWPDQPGAQAQASSPIAFLMHTPWAEQPRGQRRSHETPSRPSSQRQRPWTHMPAAEQADGQVRCEQSGPSQSGSQRQWKSWQLPCPEHARPSMAVGQVECWHHAPTELPAQ